MARTTEELLAAREKNVPQGPFNIHPIFAKEAHGGIITSIDGKEYIDFTTGIGTVNVGHCPDMVVASISDQAQKYLHTCFHVVMYEPYIELAERLNALTPGDFPKKTMFVNSGALPTKNFQSGVNDDWENLQGEVLSDKLAVKKRKGMACPACPVACGRITRVMDPEFAGLGAGPEYETIGLLGSSCGVDDLRAVSKANFICNDMGMDTISTGATIACAMELFEKGYLPEKDVGFPLNFGNAQAIVDLARKIAMREGFGDILAEGAYRLSEKYGHPEYFMGVKKQEFASYEPRALQGMGLGYATGSRGACHIRNEVHLVSIFGVQHLRITRDRNIEQVDPFEWKDKPQIAKDIQDWYSVIDSSGICNFMFFLGMDEDILRALIETATGTDMGGHEGLMRCGERIFNMERLFNLKAGLSGSDDTLPKRMLEEPLPAGPAKGMVVHLSEMLPEYYKIRGWTVKGIPSPDKLKECGLIGD